MESLEQSSGTVVFATNAALGFMWIAGALGVRARAIRYAAGCTRLSSIVAAFYTPGWMIRRELHGLPMESVHVRRMRLWFWLGVPILFVGGLLVSAVAVLIMRAVA